MGAAYYIRSPTTLSISSTFNSQEPQRSADPKSDRGVRANAITSLGQMRAPFAADLMQKLLDDPTLSANASIALYRITGKKVTQFPAGYNAD